MMPSLQDAARLLRGEVRNGQVQAPGPGHSDEDRSLSVRFDPSAPEGFLIHSFSPGDDVNACRDYVRAKLGLPERKPKSKTKATRKLVATYGYQDEQGDLLFEVLKFEPKGFAQRRPDGNGGWIWKLDGVRRVVYRLPEVIEALAQSRRIFVVEGEKDADALWKIGIPATCNRGGATHWIEDDSQFLKNADVVIVPDNDEAGRKHAEVVAKSLKIITKKLSVLTLSGLAEKGDVSDWLDAGHTADEFWALAENAPEWQASELRMPRKPVSEAVKAAADAAERRSKGMPLEDAPSATSEGETFKAETGREEDPDTAALDIKILPPPSDPMRCARKFVEEKFTHPDHPTLIYQGGQFYRWNGRCWPTMDDRYLRALAYRFTEDAAFLKGIVPKPWEPTTRKIADFLDALKAACHIPADTPYPSWLNGGAYPADEIVSCTNGLVHIPTRTLTPHTPSLYVHHSVPFTFEPEAPRPDRWLSFLHELWGDDEECIDTLQEILGYLAAGDTRQQKMFLLVGPKRSGKGTIARVLKAMIGAHNVAGPTLSSIGTNFGLSPLIGKPVAIISDARLGGSDTSIVAERLLSISGEDTLTVDRKYKEPVTLQLPTRIMILSNELPRMADASGALASRFITLVMQHSFYGREDTTLTRKLHAELPAIFNWSLDGFERLEKRGHFQQPRSSEEAIREMEDMASPIGAFVRDRCVLGPEHEIACDHIYMMWREWCTENGRERITSKQVFGRDLGAAFPGIRRSRPRDGETRNRTYVGIGKKE